MSVPMASATVTVPAVVMVTSESPSPAVPATASSAMALATPVPMVSVTLLASARSPRSMAPMAVPPTVAFAVTLTDVLASPRTMSLDPVVARMKPATETALGSVAVMPLAKVESSDAPSPIVKAPVFANVAAPVTELSAPVIETPKGCAATESAFAVRSPWNATEPVVSVSVTVPAVTAPVKVTPPLSRTVRSPPLENDRTEMSAEALSPESSTRSAPDTLETSPSAMVAPAPLPVSSTESAVRTTPVPASPSVIAEFVVITEPATCTCIGAVAVTPPANVVVSADPLPSTSTPEFRNVVAPATEFDPPRMSTLFTPDATTRPEVRARSSPKLAVPVTAVSVNAPAPSEPTAVTLVALVTVTDVSGVEPPTSPEKVMEPVPAVMPSVAAPSSVLAKATLPDPVASRVLAVSWTGEPRLIEPAESVDPPEARLMVEVLPTASAPAIAPLAFNVTEFASDDPSKPPAVRAPSDCPPLDVNEPTTEMGAFEAVGAVVTSVSPAPSASAEMPAANPVVSIEMPPAPVAVSVRTVPPSTRTASAMLIEDCVTSALMTVVFPDPATVSEPVPVIAPLIVKSPVPPDWKRAVTARSFVQAPVTVMLPVFDVLPRTTAPTDDWIRFHSVWLRLTCPPTAPPAPVSEMLPAAEAFAIVSVVTLLIAPLSWRSPAASVTALLPPFTVPIESVPVVE